MRHNKKLQCLFRLGNFDKHLRMLLFILYVRKQKFSSTSISGVVSFLTGLFLNVVVQFESTLVARLSVFVLSPSSNHPSWMVAYVAISLVMLWLLEESTLMVSPV